MSRPTGLESGDAARLDVFRFDYALHGSWIDDGTERGYFLTNDGRVVDLDDDPRSSYRHEVTPTAPRPGGAT